MPAAVPLIAVVASGVASAAVGGGIVGALVGAGAALVVTAVGGAIFPAKKPTAPTSPATTAFDASAPGAGRTQSFRQPITEHQVVFGRCKVSGPIVFLHSAPDDQGREDGHFYAVVVLAGHSVRAIGEVFPLTTSVSTVQRIMKAELERNRRQREVAFPANLSALRLRPWEGAMVALDRLAPFPARVTGWSLAPDGGVNLTLAEEDPAVWDWNPAVDERATGESPSVVLPNPGRIATPASIAVGTPTGTSFAALAVSWAAVPSAHLASYEVEFMPASVAAWQGYGAGQGATAASIPTAEPTALRVRAVARSGAVSGWREALVPAAVSAPTATGIAGGVRISGGFPADAVRLQVFEASSNSLAAASKLAAEPTSLFYDRTGLSAGETRWYWLRAVSAEGNVSALAGPVSATAL